MKLSKRLDFRFFALALGVVLLAAFVVSGTALAGRGNSGNAKLCQKGGWASTGLQNDSGQSVSFASEDECVSYGAQNGPLFKPSVTLNPTHVGEDTDSFVTVSGFHPLSTGDLTFHVLGGSDGTITFLDVKTNEAGGLPTFSTVFKSGSCADGVYAEEITYVDGSGVHASGTVTLDCS
jgi:hypothetical protein